MSFSRWLLYGSIFAVVITTNAFSFANDHLLGPKRTPLLLPESSEFLRGFTVQIDVPQESLAGYIPVQITLKATSRFSADRRFVVRFRTEPQLVSPPQNGLLVDVPLTVDQGAASQTFIRYLPKWSAGQAVTLTVAEDGRALDGYEAFFGGEGVRMPPRTRFQRNSRSNRSLLSSEYEMNWVFVSEDNFAVNESLPDLTGLVYPDAIFFDDGDGIGPDQTSRFWNAVAGASELQAIGQSELPTDWRAFQRFDAIVTNPKALERLRSNADGFEAIRDWVLNGGTVVVYNTESAPEVVEALGFTWSSNSNSRAIELLNSCVYELGLEWQQQAGAIQSRILDYESAIGQLQLDHAAAKAAEVDEAAVDGPIDSVSQPAVELVEVPMILSGQAGFESPGPLSPAEQAFLESQAQQTQHELSLQQNRLARLSETLGVPEERWTADIQIQGAGAGYVITVKPGSGRDTPTDAHWEIVASFLDHRASPTLRRGVDPLIGDRRFGRWMIPGVAQPPVYTFIGLLTVFVILVGPVAYRRTSKIGRSYLMFAIAPALALMTTLAMFSYGVLSDGFGTMARVRQLTWVDGKSGHAGERVRGTYFAGVRPTEGLRFSGDAELMLYRESSGSSWEDQDRLPAAMLGQVTVDEGIQRLDATFLPSRQQRQFVTHAPRRDAGYLQLVPDPKGILSPEVTSGFAFPLRQVVMRDQQSKYWLVENLAPNSTQAAEPLMTREASKLLGQLYNDHRPISEVRESRSTTNRYDNEIYDVVLDINRMLQTKASVTDGLFELWLQQNLQTNSEIPIDHFIGIGDVSPDVIAVEGCELKSSIRYVFGTLR